MTTRVLIVEDNPINRELIDYLLSAYGFATLQALDGAEGLELARREQPDLILCDIQMPVMDGVELARHVKSDLLLRDTPLVALTALAMVGDRDRLLAQGFDGYIAKPIEPSTFVAAVNGFLGEAQRRTVAKAPAQAAPPAAPRTASARILALDDTPFNLELKRKLLEPHGYEVVTAATVAEALQAARRQPPDLILSDVGTRDGSAGGFEFIREVKADPLLRDIPFVFLSSTHWDERAREQGLRLGALRYLLRPMEPAQLLAEIVEVLSLRPAR